MAATDGNTEQQDFRNADLKENDIASSADGTQKPEKTSAGGNLSSGDSSVNMEFLLDISLDVTVELGRAKMLINDMLKLGQGS